MGQDTASTPEDGSEATEGMSEPSPKPSRRRRASRAAGPAGGSVEAGTVRANAPSTVKVRLPRPASPPPRRQPNRRLVRIITSVAALVAALALSAVCTAAMVAERHADRAQTREQRFVDTAAQLVVNMFSYKQDTIDQSVDRFVNGTSGPLRAMMTQDNNTENLKQLFQSTNASAETVINGAALEKIDEVGKNAAVLVSARVTVTDLDGNNQPSQPYRLRIIVHEDDNGNMSAYDLKYPEGGN
jgi:Mce-associated membrane protein